MADAQEIIKILKKEYPNTKYYLNFSNPLELMVAAIMSAQVRDTVVNSVTAKLFRKYKTAEDYTKLQAEEILPVTFAFNKAKHIREAAKILVDRYRGKVPETMEELTELPGIGRKTANAILTNGFNKVEGIVVDTHVIRLSYRLGLTKNAAPEKIEKDLVAIVPKTDWKIMTWLMKDHGRAVCRAPIPYCGKCVLNKICPKKGVDKQL
jgi:endonuclease III